MNIAYTPEIIKEKRSQIREQLLVLSANIKNEKITLVNDQDLSLLFRLYDDIFLQDYFKLYLPAPLIRFSWSKRLTKSAGKTIYYTQKTKAGIEKSYEIRIATDFFFEYSTVSRDVKVGGISSSDAVEALQLVFEHELCHLIEYILTNNSSCRHKNFHTLAGKLFGHIAFTHQLPTKQEIASIQYGFQIGQKVKFEFEGKGFIGILHKIHKRAIVMVPESKGRFMDKQGTRYMKYYVPLKRLNLL